MIDIYDIVGKEPVVKDFEGARVVSLFKQLGFWNGSPDFGIDFDKFVKSSVSYSLRSFDTYLGNEMIKNEINFKSVKSTFDKTRLNLDTHVVLENGEALNV